MEMLANNTGRWGLYYEEPPVGMGDATAEELDVFEVKYHASFFRLHDDYTNDLALPSSHVYRVSNSSLHTAEELRQPRNQVPPPRSGHLLLPCPPRRSLILHGGLEVEPDAFLNDTWEYLIDEQRWIQLICRGEPRTTEEEERIGGAAAAGVHVDVYSPVSSDRTPTAAEVIIEEEMPPKAFGQCGTIFGGGSYLFVHGGVRSGNYDVAPAFCLDIERRMWRKLRLAVELPTMWGSVAQTFFVPVNEENEEEKETEETMRMHVSSSLSSSLQHEEKREKNCKQKRVVEVVVLFGGMHDSEAYNTTFFLYLTTPPPSSGKSHYEKGEKYMVVTLPSLPSTLFPGRRRACSTVCKGFFVFVFGGRDSTYFYNDLWVLNGYTRQWIMVREETPLRFMREFFLRPFDRKPGERIMEYVEGVLSMRRDVRRCRVPITIPHRSRFCNSSALWRTGAVMVTCGLEVFVFGGFTYDRRGVVETHKDVHVYNYMRHVWREACVEIGASPSPFPDGYFKSMATGGKKREGIEMEGNTCWDNNNNNISQNWELVKNMLSMVPDGRTMAAMCPDPIMPGFRFFLFGGRSEDEPSGELYDVRLDVTSAAATSSDLYFMHEREIRHCSEPVTLHPAASTSHVIMNENTRTCMRSPPPYSFYYYSPSSYASSAPQGFGRLRQRTLREQAVDWVRAVLLEESMLRRTMSLALRPGDKVVREEWLEEAHVAGAKMQERTDMIVSETIRSVVSCAPAFIRRG